MPASYAQERAAPREPVVRAVRFPGASSLDASLLLRALETRASRCKSPLFVLPCLLGDFDWAERKAILDSAAVAQDEERLETLYEIWGFPDAQVTAAVLPRGGDDVVVDFRVAEGAPLVVRALEVRGPERLTPPVRVPELPLRVGESYALPRLDAAQQRIVEAFAERGHPYAQVEVTGSVDEAARAADVLLEVDPGPAAVFGDVAVLAEPPIGERVVREQLTYRPGEPFRPSRLRETEEQLYLLPIVERAAADARPNGRAAVVPTTVTATARRVHGLELEGSVSSVSCLQLASFYRNRYFLGAPRLLSLGAGFSNLLAAQLDGGFPCTSAGEDEFGEPDYFVRGELMQPLAGDVRTRLALSGFGNRESAPRAYVQRGYGGRLALSRDFGAGLVLSLAYSLENNALDAADSYFCGNFAICDDGAIAALSDFRRLAPIEAVLLWTPAGPPGAMRRPGDVRSPLDPQPQPWRHWLRAGVEAASDVTGSQHEYTRALVEGSLTRFLGERIELAARARMGLLPSSQDVLPPQLRIYSGGVSTVRGVGQNLLGPKILVTSRQNAARLGCVALEPGCARGARVDPELVAVRPTGGKYVAEANLEARLWVSRSLQLVAFVDAGMLSMGEVSQDLIELTLENAEALVTPGVGLRVLTNLGPIRLDIGYDPSGDRTYRLIAEDAENERLVRLGEVIYNPYTFGDPGGFKEFSRRLQVHLALGQAF